MLCEMLHLGGFVGSYITFGWDWLCKSHAFESVFSHGTSVGLVNMWYHLLSPVWRWWCGFSLSSLTFLTWSSCKKYGLHSISSTHRLYISHVLVWN